MTAPGPTSPVGFIDTPEPGDHVASGMLTTWGWLVDRNGPVSHAFVTANGDVVGRAHFDWPRDDVGAEFPDVPHASRSGWWADIELHAADRARAQLALVARLCDGTWFELPGPEIVVGSRPRGGRGRAVFTIVQNEPIFLPLWLRYYGRHFNADDIYVLDHDTTDGSTSDLGSRCHVVPVHRSKSFDHWWQRATVSSFQQFLLRSYDTVLFADSDEFVLADPEVHRDLGSYIDVMDGPVARCSGFNVVHWPDEAPLSDDRPVLGQRGRWHPSVQYSKPALARVPVKWSLGFHDSPDWSSLPPDPHLLLVHLHRVDYERALARHRSAASRDWNESDLQSSLGRQNRIVDDDEFHDWFFHGDDLEGDPVVIPERFRTVL
ncbi:MAG: hypothetical protein JWO37_3436 [Acidimicrobiales bacterium]|nr:hypothetical protein [Acidimicrobiales bacterium]